MEKKEIESLIIEAFEYMMIRNWKLMSIASVGLPAGRADMERLARECAEHIFERKNK